MTKIKIKVALLCNARRVGTGFRHHESVVHLLGGLDIEFLCLEFHLISVLNGLAGLDAQQDALHFSILSAEVMGIVGGCHRDAGIPCQLDKLRQYLRILCQTMVLQLDIIVALAKQIPIPKRHCFGTVVIPSEKRLRDLARQTSGQTDQTLVILLQELFVHPGFRVNPSVNAADTILIRF